MVMSKELWRSDVLRGFCLQKGKKGTDHCGIEMLKGLISTMQVPQGHQLL